MAAAPSPGQKTNSIDSFFRADPKAAARIRREGGFPVDVGLVVTLSAFARDVATGHAIHRDEIQVWQISDGFTDIPAGREMLDPLIQTFLKEGALPAQMRRMLKAAIKAAREEASAKGYVPAAGANPRPKPRPGSEAEADEEETER